MREPDDIPALDMRAGLEVLRKRKWVILAVALSVVIATLVYHLKQVPLYEAATSLVIEPSAPRVLNSVEEVVPTGAGSFWSNTDFYETEYKILQSRSLCERVAKKLGTTEDISARLQITPVKASKMVLIQYRDTSPERAAILANTHAQAYIEYNLERKLEGTRTAAAWLSEQLGDLKTKLEDSELDMYTFKKHNNILAQSLEDRIELSKKTIEDLATQLQQAQARRIGLHARIEEIARAQNSELLREALPDVVQSPTVQNLAKLRLELDTQLVQLSQRYGEKYPKLSETREQRDAIHAQLHREITKITAGVEAEHRIALATERALAAELQRASLESLELARKGVEHNKLKRESENINRLYGVVISRLKETDLTQLLRSNNVRIVDEAQAQPTPVYPRTRSNVLLSAIAGLLLGLVVAFILNLLDGSVKTQDDVQALGLAFLGIIPRASPERGRKPLLTQEQRDLFVFEHQRSQVAECSRAIRTALAFMGTDRPLKKLLVVSAKPDEGKTTTAVHLATTFALSGQRTLLVDTDLRRPRLYKVFGVSSEVGMSSYLVGERPLEDALKRTVVPNMDVLPCGPLPPSPAELLHTAAFKALVEQLEGRYDRIVFDSPPIIAVTDAPILSSLSDGVVFVIKAGTTPRDLVRQSLAHLRAANANIVGAVMNDVDLESRAYGYAYAYYRQYGGYGDRG